jgi:uncharacterized protein YndB with AHSA1/START domain
MIDLIRSHDIPAPATAVWAVLADYRRDPEWRTGVLSMEPDTPGLARPGTTTHEVMRLGGQTNHVDAVVEEVDPGSRLTWRTTAGADANGFRLVESTGGDLCRVTLGITIRAHGAERLLVPVVRRMMGRNLERDLVALAALVIAEVDELGNSRRRPASRPTPEAA